MRPTPGPALGGPGLGGTAGAAPGTGATTGPVAGSGCTWVLMLSGPSCRPLSACGRAARAKLPAVAHARTVVALAPRSVACESTISA